MTIVSKHFSDNIKPSPILMTEVKAADLKAKGFPIISLGTGEPDFDTPENIKLAAIDAINKGVTKYTPSGGMLPLKQAIIDKLKKENQLEYSLNEICASSGAKQVIFNALLASINPGEEVIILAPYWASYPEMIKISHGIPVIVELDERNNFALDITKIEKAITSKTKWIIINSPNNPCGSVYDSVQLRELADLLIKYDHVNIMSDDIYEHIVFEQNKFYNILQIEPSLRDRTLIVNGVSKTYAMTGWRLGYGAGPSELIKAMSALQSQSTSSPSSISQMAAVEALNGKQDFIQMSNAKYAQRRDRMLDAINSINGLKSVPVAGAFYLFVNCSELFGKKTPSGMLLSDSNDLANYFLDQAHVAVVSGIAFGVQGFFRISFATSDEKLDQAINKIKEACELLS